ncbi:MAG: OmpA family protein [Pseudomonadota bacterium]
MPMRSCLLFLMLLLLTSCASEIWHRYPPPSPTHAGMLIGAAGGAAVGGAVGGGVGVPIGVAAGGIVGASAGALLEHHYDIEEKLQYNGVQVVRVGDEIKLILPADRFFKRNTPAMNPQYYPVMNLIALYLNQYNKISIKVAGYTDDIGAWQRNLALSRAQARAVLHYLELAGVDTRFLYAIGYGPANPIANNFTEFGRHMNRRIEISLRRIRPPEPLYEKVNYKIYQGHTDHAGSYD